MEVLIIKRGCVDERRFRENFSTINPSMNIVAKMKNQKKPELGNVASCPATSPLVYDGFVVY
jgi:hypothetical protein